MTRLSYPLLGLLSLAIAASAQRQPYDQEKQHRDATCGNGCFFGSFPGGSCTNDAACLCNQQKYRETYYCCMAEKCDPVVITDAIPRHFLACESHGVPIPEDFDTEGVCGITLPSTSSSTTATSTPSSTGTSSTSSASTTDESPGTEESSDATGSSSAPESSGDDSSLASRPTLGSSILISSLGALVVLGLGFS